MSMKELKRLEVMQMIEKKQMTGPQAAEVLGLSLRQVRRIIARYREQGAIGLIHGNRGREAHNRIEEEARTEILKLARKQYRDYNDSHFTDKLTSEKHGLQVSRSTVRRIRRADGLGSPRKRRSPRHRSKRERKPQAGMMLQTDGSQHDWLEGRGPKLTLIAYIDDATSEVLGAVFREEEDATGYFLGLREICQKKGIPTAIYADRHTIFQSPKKATIEQELSGTQPLSQYGRLLKDLGIELIPARSPQAKGRVERLFETLQDRLVKALREAGASNLEEANRVLASYLPKHNQRFRVKPTQEGSAYVPWPNTHQLKDFFCFKHQRSVANDNTIAFDGHRLQIPPGPKRRSYARAKVEVRQQLDGSLKIRYQGDSLVTFQPAADQPVRVGKFCPASIEEPSTAPTAEPLVENKPQDRKPHKPAADHPWRRYGQSLG
jgi:transposase